MSLNFQFHVSAHVGFLHEMKNSLRILWITYFVKILIIEINQLIITTKINKAT